MTPNDHASLDLFATRAFTPENDPLDMADRLAQGRIDWRVTRWLFTAFAKFIRDRGTTSIGRCLGLELTPAQLCRQRRDRWLVQAAAWVHGASSPKRSEALANEYDKFLTRGPWLQWRGLPHPPGGISNLRRCLFYAAQAGQQMDEINSIVESLSAKQMDRIIGHTYAKQCPEPSFTIET